MKRFKLLLFLFMLIFIGYVYADDVQPKEIGEDSGGGVDPTKGNSTAQPLKNVYSSVNGVVLFERPCKNCTLYVYNEDGDLEYTAAIPDGAVTFTLPPQFTGNYKIVFTDGDLYYEQNVSLYFVGLQ